MEKQMAHKRLLGQTELLRHAVDSEPPALRSLLTTSSPNAWRTSLVVALFWQQALRLSSFRQ